MKHFLSSNRTYQNTSKHRVSRPMNQLFQRVKNGALALALSASTLEADELTIPIGVSIIHVDMEDADLIRQKAKMCHEL